jgi:hypothetical protein
MRKLLAIALALACVGTAAIAQGMSDLERALAEAEQPPLIRPGLDGPWGIRVFGADGVRFDNLIIDSLSDATFTGSMSGDAITDAVVRRGDAAITLTFTTGRTYATDPGASSVEDGARRTHIARFRGHRIDGESMDESGVVIARWYALRPEDESDAPQRFAGRTFELRPVGSRGQSGQCFDRYAFGADGALAVTSGREVLQMRWRTLPRTVDSMLVIERTLVSGNGEPDCSGRVTEATPGAVSRLYVLFHNNGNATLCVPTFTANTITNCYAYLDPVR